LDQSLLDFFPEQAAADRPGHLRISLRHALMMSAGLDWNEDLPYTDCNDEIVMTLSEDPVGYVLTRARVAEPGTVWKYNGGLPQVLATIVQRTTGQRLGEYARTVLFAPLGITDFEWLGDLAGMPSAASGLRLRPRDLAKFGSLYLHEGQWNGRQVVPADWVHESTRPQIALTTPVSAYGKHGYGYLWWHTYYRTAVGTLEVPWAGGNGQQRIFVVPELNMVVTMLAGRYNHPTAAGLPNRLLEQIVQAVPYAS
jgi:CubicO group peptidase (beta-lactamase class C family)